MKWETYCLGDLYEVHNGLAKGREFFGQGYPFLSFSTVFNNYFIPEQIVDLVQSTDKEQENYSILRGDVFVTRTSETSDELGISCVALKDYPFATYNGFCKRMRPITEVVLPEFIGYYMRMPSFRNEFLAFSTMTTRASLRNEDLLGIKITVPSLNNQKKIANMLLSYDKLIRNNQKQIKLLEEAAQRLYKEWFVDLRFPGYENAEVIDGVPKGWSWKRLGEVATVNKYGIPKNYRESFIDYIDLSSVSSGSITNVSRYNIEDAPGRAKRIAKCGDIIWGMVRPNLKSYALVMNDTPTNIYSTGFAVITAEEVPYSFLYTLVTREEFVGYLVNCTNGAAYPAVKPVHFEDALIMVPEQGALDKFALIVNPLFEKIYALNKYNKCLQEARDRLLPKLMSGEVEV